METCPQSQHLSQHLSQHQSTAINTNQHHKSTQLPQMMVKRAPSKVLHLTIQLPVAPVAIQVGAPIKSTISANHLA